MSFFATAFGTKVAIAALSLVAVGGGTAVAAANGALPTVPSSATDTVTAPSTDPATDEATDPTTSALDASTSASATKGPDATGPAAFGLCTAYTAGGLNSHSVAYTALVAASGSTGVTAVTDYCASILSTHASNSHKPAPSSATSTDSTVQHGQSGTEHGKSSVVSHGH